MSATNRREFLQTAAAGGAAAGLIAQGFFPGAARSEDKPRSALERIGIGAIGMRYQGSVITEKARDFGEVVAICDVDQHVREQARASFGSTPRIFEDYRQLLQRPDVDVVLIGSPDHWHSKMLIDAVRAGKDVYCEKPLTLTVDEGKVLRDIVGGSDRVVQVGTWQRSDSRYRLAVEMVRAGRVGTLRKVTCVTDKNPSGGPFEPQPVPRHFNWDLWQGQTPDVPYVPERAHYTFRWWLEYSGGKLTDWGAHDVDIAQWAIDDLPVDFDGRATMPNIPGGYSVPTDFAATVRYAHGVILEIQDEGRVGTLFEGDGGRLFVNRGTIAGVAVDELASQPLRREDFRVYDRDNLDRPERAGKLDAIINHMGNFFDCVHDRSTPISDLESQHRSVSTCHLALISMRLGRPLRWDPELEQFKGDTEANGMLRREQRAGYEVA
jgi:myo-inositol 2-dehydrogenase / D-chiro-inositol 1-dehydrogenase